MATKIITVGGNVVTTTSGGTTYALSTSGTTAQGVPFFSGSLQDGGMNSGTTSSVSWTVGLPADALQIEGSFYCEIYAYAKATASAAVLGGNLSLCGVTVLTDTVSSNIALGTGVCYFMASRASATATEWTVKLTWVSSNGATVVSSGTATSPSSLISASASSRTNDTVILGAMTRITFLGSAVYTS